MENGYKIIKLQNGKILSQGEHRKMETCYFFCKGIIEDEKVTVDFR